MMSFASPLRQLAVSLIGLLLGCFIAPSALAVIDIPITGTTSSAISPQFDQRFVNFMRRWHMPGASVAIFRNGHFLLARGYGWADRENLEPVHPDSLFRIGSVSKVITTVAVLKLIQDNRASLDQPVFTILNDLSPLSGQMARNVNQVTLRNLLQMSSGWYTQVIDPMFGPWSSRMLYYLNDNIPPDCVTAAQLMMGMPLQFRPGTQYSYSNLNYCILGLVVNKLAGTNYDYKTYENYVKQAVLAPAGITSMQIGDTLPQNRAPGEVKYYRYGSTRADANNAVDNMAKIDGLPYGEAQILQKNFSDGGWIASAIDLVKFLDGLSTYKILNPTMMRIMLARPSFQQKTEGYSSMAWVIKNTAGHTYWSKHGSFTGTQALIFHDNDGTSYAVIFNAKPPQRPKFLHELTLILLSAK